MKIKALVYANGTEVIATKSMTMKKFDAVKIAEKVLKDYKKAVEQTKSDRLEFIEIFVDGEYDDDRSGEVTLEADHLIEPRHWREPKKVYSDAPVPYTFDEPKKKVDTKKESILNKYRKKK